MLVTALNIKGSAEEKKKTFYLIHRFLTTKSFVEPATEILEKGHQQIRFIWMNRKLCREKTKKKEN